MDLLASYTNSTMGLLLEGILCLVIYDQLYRWYCRKNNKTPMSIWTFQVPTAELVEEETVESPKKKAA